MRTRVRGDRKDGRRGLHVMTIVILIQLMRFIQLTISLLHTYSTAIFSHCSSREKSITFFLTNGGNFLNFLFRRVFITMWAVYMSDEVIMTNARFYYKQVVFIGKEAPEKCVSHVQILLVSFHYQGGKLFTI